MFLHNHKKGIAFFLFCSCFLELDNKKIGRNVSAFIDITVDYRLLKEIKISQHELAKKLKQHDFVEEAAMVTGGTDIIIKVRVKDIDELDDFVTKKLRNINGIEKTQSMVILNEV